MALAGGRRIVIRGKTYFWKLSGRACTGGGSPRNPHVCIQEDGERPGRAMVAWLTSKRYDPNLEHEYDIGVIRHRAALIPREVCLLVEASLDAGWDPSDRRTTYNAPAGIELKDYRTVSKPPGRRA